MITVLTFLGAGALAWGHYTWIGPLIFGGLTVWVAWFFLVLAACGVECWRSHDRQCQIVWGVQALGWIASMMTWMWSSYPLVNLAIKNLVIASTIALVSVDVTVFLIAALLHCLMFVVALMSFAGAIPSAALRPRAFLAWSYPDIAAAIQHACLIITGGRAAGLRSIGAGGFLMGDRDQFADLGSARDLAKAKKNAR